MRLERISLADALGCILAENVSAQGRRVSAKGTVLGPPEIERIRRSGVEEVIAARLDPHDVNEQAAALRIAAELAAAARLEMRAAYGGRVCLLCGTSGVVDVDTDALLAFNRVPGVTLATRRRGEAVRAGERVATLKVIPLAVSEEVVQRACDRAAGAAPRVQPWRCRRVEMLVTGDRERATKLLPGYEAAMRRRLHQLGSFELRTHIVGWGSDPEAELRAALCRTVSCSDTLVLLAGDTACMDPADVAPSAIQSLGGRIDALGAPVFPGNLLLVATLGECIVVGLPGCVRSNRANVIDLVLPRVLAGHKLGQEEVDAWGHGGLLFDSEPAPAAVTRGHTSNATLEI